MAERDQVIRESAQLAGEAVRNVFPSAGIVQKDGWANIVTAADLASEKAIIKHIKSNFPDDAILS